MATIQAGNWQKFDSFAWYDRPDNAEEFAIVYTCNRDSGLITQSNAQIIAEALAEFTEGESPDVIPERHNHWACGWVDGFAIRAGTRAAEVWDELQARMDDYPILDESHYSQMETDAQEAAYIAWVESDFIRELEKFAVYGIDVEIELADNPENLGAWVANPPELFATGKPRKVYRYTVANCRAAFRELFDLARERANVEWEEDSIDVKRVAEEVTEDELLPFITVE